MNVFQDVKANITTRQAAERYGLSVSRNGMVCCPFHDDRHPSMKVDGRFYCFGCGEKGDVIDFTAKLFGISPKEAAEKLACDFGIAPGCSTTYQPHIIRRNEAAKKFEEDCSECFRIINQYQWLLRQWREDYAPNLEDESWDDRFVESLQMMDYVSETLDVLILGSIEERYRALPAIKSMAEKIQQRLQSLTDCREHAEAS